MTASFRFSKTQQNGPFLAFLKLTFVHSKCKRFSNTVLMLFFFPYILPWPLRRFMPIISAIWWHFTKNQAILKKCVFECFINLLKHAIFTLVLIEVVQPRNCVFYQFTCVNCVFYNLPCLPGQDAEFYFCTKLLSWHSKSLFCEEGHVHWHTCFFVYILHKGFYRTRISINSTLVHLRSTLGCANS